MTRNLPWEIFQNPHLLWTEKKNKKDAEKYREQLRKIAGDIDKKEIRTRSDFFKAL